MEDFDGLGRLLGHNMGKDAKAKKAPSEASRRYVRYCLMFGLAALAIFTWISMLSFSATDLPRSQHYPTPPLANWGGLLGAALSYGLRYLLGEGSYMLLMFATVVLGFKLLRSAINDMPWRVAGITLMIVVTAAASHLFGPEGWQRPPVVYDGGVLGISVAHFLNDYLGRIGAWVAIIFGFGVAVLLTVEHLVLRLPHFGRHVWNRHGKVVLSTIGPIIQGTVDMLGGKERAAAPDRPRKDKPEVADKPAARPDRPEKAEAAGQSARAVPAKPDAQSKPKDSDKLTAAPTAGAAGLGNAKAAPADGEAARTTALALRPRPLPRPVAQPRSLKNLQTGQYQLPGLELLADPSCGYQESQEALVEEKRAILQKTMEDFGVDAHVISHMTGPVISMFELSVAPGVKVSRIAALAPDIARALAVPGVRVVSPLPGRDTVGIEVPNLNKETVRLKELMALAPDAADTMQLPLYLGKDAAGEPIVADLASMPHCLLAGTTGSGKSVCINSILTSLLLTRTPDQVRLILVDPKMVEMAAYENIPHLLCPIVNDMRRVEDILEWAATKMDERYEMLKEAGVKNIVQFNRLTKDEIYTAFGVQSEEDKAKTVTHMVYMVIVIDELADLIMTASKEVEGHIIRIAQKARAVGIHLIVATQRPSVNVVTGLIKSNMPCRISFRVASRQESRIVLDQNGADVLLGKGDMLFLQPGSSHLVRAQGSWVDDNEIRSVVNHVRSQTPTQFLDELVKLQSGAGGEEGALGEKDELFDQAVEIILQNQRGSVSLLQRRLQVGYSRASRIVDQMAEAGILGDYKGSQARECMMTLDDWKSLKSHVQADQTGASSADGTPTSV